MTALEIVLLVLVLVVIALIAGGYVAAGRRAKRDEARLRQQVEAANEALAQAHAGDNGWDRAQMEAAARSAFADGHGGDGAALVHLVQVIDRPGTDADEAVFRVVGAGGHEHEVVIRRAGDAWTA